VNPDRLFERFAPGVFAFGNFDHLVMGARELLASPEFLEVAQDGCARFVAELHDNDRNVDAFLEGMGIG